MRGKAASESDEDLFDGITPAYAGKSCSNIYRIVGIPGSPPPMRGKVPRGTPRQQISRDHPRLCGEKTTFGKPLFRSIGSPPPMRGKVFCSQLEVSCMGITPAYAGKSS